MIVLLRVDERLIHGQVAMTWTKSLQIDGIVVVKEEAFQKRINEYKQRKGIQ